VRSRISSRVGRYPDNIPELVDAIAQRVGAKREHILLSTGSGEELDGAIRAFVSKAKPLVTAAPSYEGPERAATDLGYSVKRVTVLPSQQLDLDAMAAAATGAGLVYICNPNNPTALVESSTAIAAFVRKVKASSPDTAILLDEAYMEFAKNPAAATGAALALEHPGVFVTRTFSKVYGMAGLRLGFAIGQPGTLERLKNAWGYGSVNVLTAAAALAGLGDTAHVRWEIDENRKVRDFTLAAFKELGYSATDSHTNFVWVNVRRPSKDFRDACFKAGVLVGRDFAPMEKSHSRISLGSLDEMRQAMAIFRKVLTPASSAA
jgi:histidinol-phosphate aminotransferase